MEKYKDKNLPVEERIKDLISRMTMDEKVKQIDQYSARDMTYTDEKTGLCEVEWETMKKTVGDTSLGVVQNFNSNAKVYNKLQKYALENTRLGIPILFCQEALHGFCKQGATVFPQQMALASTFEPYFGEEMGAAIALEARTAGIQETWNPVCDLAREPRWGRTEENFGEDTYLASRFAYHIVRGLQGDDISRHDKVASEVKHYTGYGIPAGGLNCSVAAIGRHELFEYCQPVFEAAIKEAGAYNAMCSYSSIDSQPVPSDHELLTEVLRDQWGMRGFVRSDMCAVSMLTHGHNVADTHEEAVRMALEAGTDVQLYDFPHDEFQNAIKTYVADGRMSMETLDTAVSRMLRVKFDLGLFDNPFIDENREHEVFHCKEHIDLAYRIAKKSITLLKNENNTLPLSKNLKKIAVLGPSADELCFGDYSVGTFGYEDLTLYKCIKSAVSPSTEVVYAKGCEYKEFTMRKFPRKWLKNKDGMGLVGKYYNNPEKPEGEPALTRIDNEIDFSFIATKVAESVNSSFSATWEGILEPEFEGEVFIGFTCKDSVKLWIDGELFIDAWGDKRGDILIPFNMKRRKYEIKIEYRNDERGASVIFGFKRGECDPAEAFEVIKGADVAVLSMGDFAGTSGENLDRCDLNLPGKQLDFVKAIYETGIPVVLVLQSGRPMTINWENENLPAIVQAFFAGEQGGKAITDVLFGDVNPSGRLPMSFPKHVGQLPIHYSRKPAGGRNYVEGIDKFPLFWFGYGLSYTTFEYSDLSFSSNEIGVDEELTVTFKVTNTGNREGEEVAQVYIRDHFSSVVKPLRELKGIAKVNLLPGETKSVSVVLGNLAFRTLNPKYEWVVEPGKMRVMIGKNAGEIVLQDDFNII